MKALVSRLWNSPTFMTWGSLATRLLTVTLVLPMVLTHFGAGDIAVWQLFTTLTTLVLVLDFGLGPTFSRFVAYARGGATLADLSDMRKPRTGGAQAMNVDTLRAVFSTLRWAYLRMALLGLLIAAGAGTAALVRPMQHVSDTTGGWVAWGIVLVSCTLSILGTAYASALQGLDRIALLRRWEIATALGQIFSAALVLVLGGNLLALVAVSQGWVVFGVWRNWRLIASTAPELHGVPSARVPEVASALWPAAWRSGLGVLMSQGIIQASGVLYGQVAQPGALASYLLALRVMTMISQFSQAPFYSKLPHLAALHAGGRTQEAVDIARQGMWRSYWVLVAGAVAVMVAGQPALTFIGSHVGFVDARLWGLISVAFFLERFSAMHLQLTALTNRVIWHIGNGISGLIMLVVAYALFPHWSIEAFPLGMIAGYGGFLAWFAVYNSSRELGFNPVRFERAASFFPGIALGCITVFAGIWLNHHGR